MLDADAASINAYHRPRPTPSSADEREMIAYLSEGRLSALTDPSFPHVDASLDVVALLEVAGRLPKKLRLRAFHLAANLAYTGDWASEVDAAARAGEPVAVACLRALRNGHERLDLQAEDAGLKRCAVWFATAGEA